MEPESARFIALRYTMNVDASSFRCVIHLRVSQMLDCRRAFSGLTCCPSVLDVGPPPFAGLLNLRKNDCKAMGQSLVVDTTRDPISGLTPEQAGKLRRVNPRKDKRAHIALAQTSGLRPQSPSPSTTQLH